MNSGEQFDWISDFGGNTEVKKWSRTHVVLISQDEHILSRIERLLFVGTRFWSKVRIGFALLMLLLPSMMTMILFKSLQQQRWSLRARVRPQVVWNDRHRHWALSNARGKSLSQTFGGRCSDNSTDPCASNLNHIRITMETESTTILKAHPSICWQILMNTCKTTNRQPSTTALATIATVLPTELNWIH